MYAFREAVAYIQKNYFEGQPALFPDVAKDLSEIISDAGKTVNDFNAVFADGVDLFKPIDLKVLRKNANLEVKRVMTYIMDAAKIEALDCLGDTETAVKLAEKYL